MKAIVVGCGRVGSAVAKKLTKSGWDVTAIDENEEALARLGEHWSGGFVVGHGMPAFAGAGVFGLDRRLFQYASLAALVVTGGRDRVGATARGKGSRCESGTVPPL